jgi:transcription elongation factor GreA
LPLENLPGSRLIKAVDDDTVKSVVSRWLVGSLSRKRLFVLLEVLIMEFLTPEEKRGLEAKLEELKAFRPVITQRIAEARALGDLKENADYHAARDDQGLNEAEIRRLEERLRNVTVADNASVPDDIVFVGAVVKLRDTDNESEDLYKLVGEISGRFDSDEIEVSVSSPMGEALMKSRVGDVVKVDLPRGTKRFEIVQIM